MGISLSGVEAWAPNDQLPPGAYVAQPKSVERDKSSNGHPQVKVSWRVAAGEYTGAELNDWITLTERSLGNVAMVLQAAGIETPATEFETYEAMADWLAGALNGVTVEMVVRLEPSRKDPSKEWPTVKGYRRPSASDIPGDPIGGTQPQVKKDDLPF